MLRIHHPNLNIARVTAELSFFTHAFRDSVADGLN